MKKSHQYFYVFVALASGCLLAWLTASSPTPREVIPALRVGGRAEESSAVVELELALEKKAPPAGLLSLVERVGVEDTASARSSGVVLLEKAYHSSTDSKLRAASLAYLERLGSPHACSVLARIFRLGNEDASQAAIRLSRISGHDCAPGLKAIIEKEERKGELAVAALRAIGKTRSRALAKFCEDLCSIGYEPGIRREAAEALGRIAEKSSIPVLARLLEVEDDKLRRASILSLGLIRSDASAQALRTHGKKTGLGPVEVRLIEEALGRLQGREPARLK